MENNEDEEIKVIKYNNDNEQNKISKLSNINEEEDQKNNNKTDWKTDNPNDNSDGRKDNDKENKNSGPPKKKRLSKLRVQRTKAPKAFLKEKRKEKKVLAHYFLVVYLQITMMMINNYNYIN